MRELHRNVSAPNDDEAARLLWQTHDGLIGVIRRARLGNGGRDLWARASCDNNLVARDDVIASLNSLRPNELSVLVIHGNIWRLIAATVRFTAFGDFIDAVGKYTVDDGIPIDVGDLTCDA